MGKTRGTAESQHEDESDGGGSENRRTTDEQSGACLVTIEAEGEYTQQEGQGDAAEADVGAVEGVAAIECAEMKALAGKGNCSEGRQNNEETGSGKSPAHKDSVQKVCDKFEEKSPHYSVEGKEDISCGWKDKESEGGFQGDPKNKGAYRGVQVQLEG